MLAAIVGVTLWSSGLDGPIEAPRAVQLGIDAEADGRPATPLPLLDAPCTGPVIRATARVTDPHFAGAELVVCAHELAGAIAFRLDRELPIPARPVFRIPGNVHLGGPLATDRGALLYRTPDGVRYVTSDRKAGRVSREPVPSSLVFGHASWGPGQLEAELEAGAWEVAFAEARLP